MSEQDDLERFQDAARKLWQIILNEFGESLLGRWCMKIMEKLDDLH